MRARSSRLEHNGRRGFGLVELLVTVAIGGIILVVVASYFSFQTRITRENQARNELNVRARAVAEAIAQDLRLAGSRAAVDSRGAVGFVRDPGFCGEGLGDRCVDTNEPDDGDVGTGWLFSAVYVTSLFLDGNDVDRDVLSCDANPVCRRVDYFLGPADARGLRILYRRDVERAGIDTPLPAAPEFSFEFATGISGIEVDFVCGDAATAAVVVDDPALCFSDDSSLIREARVRVTAESTRVPGLAITQETSTAMLNLRAPDRFR